MIYLDYAAATPIDKEVLRAMQPYFSEKFHNPSALYLAARDSRLALEEARNKVAQCLGAKPSEIVFTAGATEANNLAIAGVMSQFPGAEILASAIEHDSVLEPGAQFKLRRIPVTKQGIVDLKKLEAMINDKTVMVSVMMVNNELGTIQPIKEITKILNREKVRRMNKKGKNKPAPHQILSGAVGNRIVEHQNIGAGLSKIKKSQSRPLYLHSDVAQAGNFFDLHVSRLGVDLMSLNGGKIYGPKQTGALYIRTGVKLRPLILGGGQESGLRSGTENVAGVTGLAEALHTAQARRHSESKRLNNLRQQFNQGLATKLASAVINGSAHHQSPHLVSVTFPGVDNERLIMELDEAGIQAAAGSACSTSAELASHVLKAVGLSDKQAQSTLRFSLGRTTTAVDIEKTIGILSHLTRP